MEPNSLLYIQKEERVMSELRGALGFKGERGYSAYEIAIKNGFIGSEEDWLATLGTSTHFVQTKSIYTTEMEESTHLLPDTYTSNSFLDIYVDGKHLALDKYLINNGYISYSPSLPANSTVEFVVTTASTNNLPIVTTIDENSTNETTPSTKTVYLALLEKQDKSEALSFEIEEEMEEVEDGNDV